MAVQLEDFQDRLGYRFADEELLLRALTHRSLMVELKPPATARLDNEQLEFLGDAILGFLVSLDLVKFRPDSSEGELSRLKSHLVSAAHLHETALRMGLGEQLRLGKGEDLSGGRRKRALLANAMEAVIAAIYLDGGLDACHNFVERWILRLGDPEAGGDASPPVDPKSALQQAAQARKLPMPKYILVSQHGPEHAKLFTVEARVGRDLAEQGQGHSKKVAGQAAAQRLLERLSSEVPAQSLDSPDGVSVPGS